MADWVTITALILSILALAAAVGVLIWSLIANTAVRPAYGLQTIEGSNETATSGGGDLICLCKSSAAKLTLTINTNSSATTGRIFIIINNGAGPVDVVAGSGVTIPNTTIAKDASITYALIANNVYNRIN